MPPTKKEVALGRACADRDSRDCGSGASHGAITIRTTTVYRGSSYSGWKLRAGASGVVTSENSQFVQINSHGFRDRERAYDKPANTLRIAVFGNSWTEALQVPLEKTYTTVLEQKDLRGRGCFAPKQVEVLNFGVAGYSTAQELIDAAAGGLELSSGYCFTCVLSCARYCQ